MQQNDQITLYFIQSNNKHNQLIQQGVTWLHCFIVNKSWSTAIKIIYQIFLQGLQRNLEKTFWHPKSDPTWVTFVCKIAW